MGINLGQTSMKAVYFGQTAVKSVFIGSNQVWGGEEPAPTADWLCFTAEETNAAIRLDKNGSPNAIYLEASDDGGATWKDYGWTDSTGDTYVLANVGDKVYFRAKNENLTFSTGSSNYYIFKGSNTAQHQKVSVSGNIQTLLKKDGSRTDVLQYGFYRLFAYLNIVSVTNLRLPATTLAANCYERLFQGCTSLTTAPSLLPATTLASSCYSNMFIDCTSLTSAPALPATTLASYCYNSMFIRCTSLTSAPALPATTLAGSCYADMFNGCTSLTTAPALPATTLATYCYWGMFKGCTSLTSAPALQATTLVYNCYQEMFKGCTSLTTAPALPATTLVNNCYREIFSNCSSLSSVEVAFTAWSPSNATDNWLNNVAASGTFTCPAELPDTRGASNIPTGWTKEEPIEKTPLTFTAETSNSKLQLDKVGSPGAVSLEYSTDGVTWSDYTWSGSDGATLTLAAVGDKIYMRAKNENQTFSTDYQNYYRFVNYVASRIAVSGNIQTLLKADGSRTDAPANCFRSLFSGCVWLTHAPNLPATTIGSSCYNGMFNGCTSLTTAPALPATTLASGCYSSMFMSCSSLSSVEVAFTEWTSGATTNWLYGVAAAGTFTCPSTLPDTRGASNIPVGWQVVNPVVAEPLCFTAEQTNSTVALNKFGSPDAISIETSTDGSSWTDYSWSGNTGTALTLSNVGDKVYFRAKTENTTIGKTRNDHYRFALTGLVAASGNIQTLLKADGSRTDAPTYGFYNMFFNQEYLTSAPELPATTLGSACYNGMFYGCKALTTAPALPATTLASDCYSSMFTNCTSLTAAPELPATTLVSGCYSSMFTSCTSLASIKVGFTAWKANTTSYWFNYITSQSGTFICPAELPDTRGTSNIPEGWTKVDAA